MLTVAAGMDREQFAERVHEAIARLNDRPYLQTHPLAGLLRAGHQGGPAGEQLQRLLLEAIDELRPRLGGQPGTPERRRYEYLRLHYVEDLTHEQTAHRLGVSLRQGHRDHHEALANLVDLLWARFRPPASAGDATAAQRELTRAPQDTLAAELARLGASAGRGPTSLRRALDDAVDTVAELAASGGARIRLSLPADVPELGLDGVVLREALVSLLSYALESAPGGEVQLQAVAGEDRVELAVLASAPRSARPAEGGATGRSEDNRLLVAKQLLELQGGALELLSTGGAARLFVRVGLPAVTHSSVLLIDDNPDFVGLLRRYLHGRPYHVLEANDAERALQLAREARPGTIVLDVLMPSQDGWYVLRQLRKLEETRDVPVVICSVLEDRAVARSLGATHFLPKPVTQRALLEVLAECRAVAGTSRGSPAGSV